ncbi:MAG: cation:proton antiporter [Alphaproteobacteria bacterium]
MSALLLAAAFLTAAAFFAPLAKRIGLSSIIGYLIAGLLIGPSGFALIYSDEEVDDILHLAEFGVVLLLFIIGLELRPARLMSMRADILGAGGLQVGLTAAAIALIGIGFGLGAMEACVIGGALAFSSTAFVLQFLTEKGHLTQRHGRLSFSVLLFQDIAAIPLIVAIPLISPSAEQSGNPLHDILLAVGIVALVLILGRYVLRYVYRFVAATGVAEGMTAAALLTVVSVALLMEIAGLSAALGAFLAGMLIGGSEYRHEIKANIAPFERILLGVFFTAVGMALDVRLLIEKPFLMLALALGLTGVKALVLYGVGRWRKLKPANAALFAAGLSQGGEFAFVIFAVAVEGGLIAAALAGELAVAVTVSMALTPLLFFLTGRAVKAAGKEMAREEAMPEHDQGHVIIAGFGPFGQIPARILAAKKIPFTALDMSSDRVDFLRRFGAQVYYGDPSRDQMLEAAEADKARALILAMPDPEHATAVAETVRRLYPALPIYARARDRLHAYELLDLGVAAVERETYHSSLVLAEEVLVGLGESRAEAKRAVSMFKEADQKRFVEDYPDHKDVETVVESARRAAAALERQFERDREDRGEDGATEAA